MEILSLIPTVSYDQARIWIILSTEEIPLVEVKAREDIFVKRSTAEIFARLREIELTTGWSSALVSLQKKMLGTSCLGMIVQCLLPVCGKWLEMLFEVVEYEPEHYLSLKSISGYAPCFLYYQFEPVEQSGTELSFGVALHLVKGHFDLEEQVIMHQIGRQIKSDLQALKDILES